MYLTPALLDRARRDWARSIATEAVELLDASTEQDATGGQVETWVTVATCRGRVVRDSAPRETVAAERVQGVETYEVRLTHTMRRTDGAEVPTVLTAAQRLRVGGETLEAAGGDALRSQRLYLSVTAVRAR